MARDTPRDRVWSYGMMKAIEGEPFAVEHVESDLEEPPSPETIEEVADTMVDHGWLARRESRGRAWEPGPEAEKLERKRKRSRVTPHFL